MIIILIIPETKRSKVLQKKRLLSFSEVCDIKLKRITLAPPLLRTIAPYSIFICYLLEKLLILNTHYIGTIKKPT